jgi:tetratricopeptide (TPR) repeat protein
MLSFAARPKSTIYIKQGWRLYRVIMPLMAGGSMLAASLLPWLVDPLGKAFPAWQLPVDIGWQLRSGLFSYGLLCLCCALYAFFIAFLTWKQEEQRAISPYKLRRHYTLAGILCLIPIGMFFIQYLFIDMTSIAQLAQHEFQTLFIYSHFGYQVSTPFIPIQLNTFNPSTLNDRSALLMDQVQIGLYLPVLAMLCLFATRHMLPVGETMRMPATPATFSLQQKREGQKRRRAFIIIACFILLLIVLGRGPAALVCQFQAEHLLSTGEYASALTWLDRASTLNPSLEQLSTYHIERGQAWYYLHPDQPSMESLAYLADFYLSEDDYSSAYQELIDVRQQSLATSIPTWLTNELSTTLTRLAELQRPLNGTIAQRVTRGPSSIMWLNVLTHTDPGNVYAHYTLGRIAYDQHDFTTCEKQMLAVLNLSSESNILSSAYTYLSLSDEAEGKDVQARDYLFEAQAFDPAYRNNTAREEISGLR